MRSFFIDLENVRSYGLEGILLLKPEDKVYVFYSDNANTLTIPTIESLNESSAKVKYIKTNYIGANAMDFQIVTLLGASIEKEQKGSFYIISHDNGFKSAVKFCEGYFTGYDIVTGVFANILLALNSEKRAKPDDKTVSRFGKNDQKLDVKAEKSSKQASKKSELEKKAESGAKASKPVKSAAPDEAEKSSGNAKTATDTAEKNAETAEKEAMGSRNRRRRGRNQKNHETVSDLKEDKLSLTDEENMTVPLGDENNDGSENPPETTGKKTRSRNHRRRGRNRGRSEESMEMPEEGSGEKLEAEALGDASKALDAEKASGSGRKSGSAKKSAFASKGESDSDTLDVPDSDYKEEYSSSVISDQQNSAAKKTSQKVSDTVSDHEDASNGNETSSKRRRRNRRSGRGSDEAKASGKGSSLDKNNSKSTDQGKEESKNSGSEKLSGNYKYVHNALSDYLSKKTIDIYAAKIDEGIKKSANRNELHEFFRKSYGQDEAEALYKIIASDFDKMKKESGK